MTGIENNENITESEVLVKDVMSSPLITVKENTCIPMVAKIMEHFKIGCVVVTGEEGEPLGIITERDLVVRILTKISDSRFIKLVVGEDVNVDGLTAGKIMSSPIITISPDETLVEAARRMRKHNVRRLVVANKGKSIGIITNKDILVIAPELIEILLEKLKIAKTMPLGLSEHLAIAGYCEQCGNWSSNLKESNGNLLCEGCGE